MTTTAAAITAIAIVLVLLASVAFGLSRVASRESRAEETRGVPVWDAAAEQWVFLAPGAEPGPGQLTARQVDDADQLELLYLAPAYDPELDAGCDRLRAAIRDEQNKGEL